VLHVTYSERTNICPLDVDVRVLFLPRAELADDVSVYTFALEDVLIGAQAFEPNWSSSMNAASSDAHLCFNERQLVIVDND
jgi:hypothetical protein